MLYLTQNMYHIKTYYRTMQFKMYVIFTFFINAFELFENKHILMNCSFYDFLVIILGIPSYPLSTSGDSCNKMDDILFVPQTPILFATKNSGHTFVPPNHSECEGLITFSMQMSLRGVD